jgi:hypothetical protein
VPGKKVRCPWCGLAGVDITRRGLGKHTREDDSDAVCEGWRQQVAIGEDGRVEKRGA